jgi:hypothetical protein
MFRDAMLLESSTRPLSTDFSIDRLLSTVAIAPAFRLEEATVSSINRAFDTGALTSGFDDRS